MSGLYIRKCIYKEVYISRVKKIIRVVFKILSVCATPFQVFQFSPKPENIIYALIELWCFNLYYSSEDKTRIHTLKRRAHGENVCSQTVWREM